MHLLNLSSHTTFSYGCFSALTLLNEKTIYQRCINFLMTEVSKYVNRLSPDLINEIFRLKSNYHNLRNFNQFETYIPKTKYH